MGQPALKNQREFDLEDRLIDFAVMIIQLAESLPKTGLINGHNLLPTMKNKATKA